MNDIYQYSWLIPILPLFSTLFLGSLLLLFTRTMNRLSKPVFAISFFSALLSASLSYFLLVHEYRFRDSPVVFDLHQDLFSLTIDFSLSANFRTSILLTSITTLYLILMLYLNKPSFKQKGFVRNIVLIGFGLSTFLSFVFLYPL